jgi:hypothetical protein
MAVKLDVHYASVTRIVFKNDLGVLDEGLPSDLFCHCRSCRSSCFVAHRPWMEASAKWPTFW